MLALVKLALLLRVEVVEQSSVRVYEVFEQKLREDHLLDSRGHLHQHLVVLVCPHRIVPVVVPSELEVLLNPILQFQGQWLLAVESFQGSEELVKLFSLVEVLVQFLQLAYHGIQVLDDDRGEPDSYQHHKGVDEPLSVGEREEISKADGGQHGEGVVHQQNYSRSVTHVIELEEIIEVLLRGV